MIGPLLAGCVGEVGESGSRTIPSGGPTSDLPCEVETLLASRCWGCHGQTPLPGLPSLASVAALTAPARSNPSMTAAQMALSRVQDDAKPMPPAPATRATPDEIAALSAWVAAGYPGGSGCGPVCTSGWTWAGGNEGSPDMNPGMACINCHASEDEGPHFAIAGTLYPTVHEPDRCYGADGAGGAEVVITGADGRTLTLAPNAAGNFFSEAGVALPYQAKVLFMGRERMMTARQTMGDCNACHTQTGANNAPGRILLP
jgi:mono/diheme cytochrome c family protein